MGNVRGLRTRLCPECKEITPHRTLYTKTESGGRTRWFPLFWACAECDALNHVVLPRYRLESVSSRLPSTLTVTVVGALQEAPLDFQELVSSSGWIAGNTTEPQTPSAFASQQYGFWPLGGNLTVYANLQGGGIELLGTQKVGSNEYQASFYIKPWSGGVSSVQRVEGGHVVEYLSTLNPSSYPSPLPQGLEGLYNTSYPASGEDTKAVFTNIWGAKTTVGMGVAKGPGVPVCLLPETAVAAFGIAALAWLVVSGILRTKRSDAHT
jgi:hypothetical protein